MFSSMITRVWHAPDDSIHVLLTLHTADPPSDEAWQIYLDGIVDIMQRAGGDLARARSMSISDGGHPDVRQRDRLNQLLKKVTHSRGIAAIVTDDILARGVIRALGWFNPDVRAFSRAMLSEAIGYLAIQSHVLADFQRFLTRSLDEFPLEGVRERVARLTTINDR
jgi:hypothetical protein